ncbi:MAG: FAD-binding oxidoreductase, partial [Actinomycetes bacterium]
MTDTAIRWAALDDDPDEGADGSGWSDELDGRYLCVGVADETHDVKSFRLRPPRPRRHRFHAGQYLTVTVSIDGHEVQRCYTIASSPLRSGDLTITVKRVPGGPVSNWLHDNLWPGETLQISGPMGRFTIAEHPADRYLFLSAGSGITPLMSMTRTIHGLVGPADVLFVHCARTPADIIFRDELRETASESSGIRVVAVCEDDAPDEQWAGVRGRLTRPVLEAIAPDLASREVFTCGPPPYMEAVRSVLAELGADADRCHEETFTFPGLPEPEAGADVPPAAGSTEQATETYTVEFRRSGRTIECASDTPLLLAAARAGLTLPSSCGEGVCGTCKSTMLEGSVDMNHAGGIRPREIASESSGIRVVAVCED